jgi:sugar lactone lactonase YvrE
MKNLFTTATTFLLALICLSACSKFDLEEFLTGDGDQHEQPAEITFTEENLFPEGIEWDVASKRFLVSSLVRGSIGQVSDDGTYREWINDPDIPSTIGIHIDQPRQRLLVAVSDPGVSSKSSEETLRALAGLAAYDLISGERLFYTRLDALLPDMSHFANDIAVDKQGSAYVTDSFTGVIYKVNKEGEGSIFFQSAALDPAPGAFGLNGIDYDTRGYLIVAKSDEGKLLRFPLNKPSEYTEIEVPTDLPNPDGLYLKNNKELVVVNNANGSDNAKVVTLTSTNKWASTQVADTYQTGAVFPTTATVRQGQVYVLYGYLHVLFSGGSQREFMIKQVE